MGMQVIFRRLICLALLISPCLPALAGNSTGSLDILFHSNPPLSYEEGGQRSGYIAEILDAMLHELPITTQSHYLPVARAFQTLAAQKNTLMYPVTRLPERESLYEWIGPVAQRSITVYKLKTRKDIQISQISDLNHYRLGIVRELASSKSLIANPAINKENIDFAPTPESNFRKFLLGRNDLIVASEWTAIYMMRSMNHSMRELEPVMVLDQQHQYYIALNKNSNPELVSRLRAAFYRLEKSGLLEQLKQKYLD